MVLFFIKSVNMTNKLKFFLERIDKHTVVRCRCVDILEMGERKRVMHIFHPKRYGLWIGLAMCLCLHTSVFSEVEDHTFLRYSVFNPQKTAENARPTGANNTPVYTLLAFGYGPFGPAIEVRSVAQTADTGVLLTSVPLVYPNPFRIGIGGVLGYRLSKNIRVEMRIFDMRGNQVYRGEYAAGQAGGLEGYNRLQINRFTFQGHDLSSGVYFIVLIADGRVIGKTKMVVTP